MKKSTFKHMLVLSLMLFGLGITAQNNALWTKASANETQNRQKAERNAMPQEYNLFELNTSAFKKILSQAPARNSGSSNTIISLPTNNGVLQNFRVYEASIMEQALQAKHTDIRSYVAQGIEDPTSVARFSVSPIGVNVMISSPKFSTIYVDPFTKDKNYYISYNINTVPAYSENFVCHTEDHEIIDQPLETRNANDGTLRTFRLALACTGEYAQRHLTLQGVPPSASDAVKKAAVLSAMNVSMTRVNGIYEREVAVTMVIIANNEDIIFLNSATDPYTNNNGQVMLGQNQVTVDGVIGVANYDIGHVFSTGGGGIARLRSPCVNGNKAQGVTGLPTPIGDNFDVDFVAHEMGHQYGANHTFNNACGGNRNGSTAFETGSGTTIMGYAGVCPPNVQPHSDDYFQAISIQEIWTNIKNGQGQCGAQTPTNNLPPTADAGPDYRIPKGTPFILKGIATDPDSGNALSHCWEQMDSQPSTQPPVNTSTVGPTFRSIDPLPDPERYMPALTTVLAGNTQTTWEVVPKVGRSMKFRYTVRDNAAAGGSTASDNMNVTVDGVAGPFVVSSQNTATTWNTTTTETVTWDVAGTDIAPISSTNVDIMFSTDGGQTYPLTIATVPNNGSAVINVPNLNTTTGRLMVKSSNNIFYDLNDGVITVTGVVGVEEFTFENFAVYPNPSNGTFNLTFTPANNDNVEVSLYDLRGRAISQSTFDDVSASNTFTKQLDYNYVETGMYFLVVRNGNKVTTKKVIKN
ncbi:Developmentally Regulated MAPK Interacting Protein [Aequorivita sublithincola DSM 14238]|uniref:Developmentally Regulated MAPK Interacting Protein n=1 Tax=Aequorivita sublithincola (strain DSM 14238 / LMG 21431 / ACAM 643 / 9-3) TaxID=746697 RepID=I3YT83_AEQSU|nr:zinc-dependent metalloprotease family protein [Aequorivita sublithincola]AFL80201.1 Developmentally Regulated MAPK Interacting Protein [Aequorivita sublithincola DSM 14238]